MKYPAYLPVPKGKKFRKHKKSYKGIPMKQSDNAPEVFKKFFSEQKFDRVIELGTGVGGFTLFLAEQYGDKVHTFDITNKLDLYSKIKITLKKMGVSINVQNIFETDDVKNLIEKPGRVLVLCDNGNKVEELHRFAGYLKSNDVIMVHDYFPNENKYHKQNIWKCCAFIDSYVHDDTIYPYYAKEFEEVFWMCRIKE